MKPTKRLRDRLSRRDFLRVIKRFVASFFTLGAVSSFYSLILEPDWVDTEHVEISLPRLSAAFDGFRIVHLSDIHIGGWMNRERLARVVDLTQKEEPDLIVVTGDHVFGHAWSDALDAVVDDYIAEMSRLTARYPVLGVLGNHDHWSNAKKVRSMLARSKVKELNNDVHSIERNGEKLHIAGVDDIWDEYDRLDHVMAKLPDSGAAILLAHEPDYADTSARTRRFDLQLSGHSHGGQVVLPFVGAPALPYLGRKYYSGLYKVREMWQYTNRGVGMTSPFVRFNCRPEITVITLRAG